MSKYTRYISLLLLLQILLPNLHGQYFATLKVNTKSVYKQQPLKASVTVYTSTWFTDPPDLGAVSIPNSFVLPFKRTVSGIQYVNSKQYATLEFFYLIFPYESGELTIPELNITISTPAEGEYKGVKRQLKTKPITIQVKDAPAEFKGNSWMVAKDAYIKESWDKNLNTVKVGDVIERTITIRALGTLPAFIAPSEMSSPDWASIYPREPFLQDTRTNQDANGQRIEKYRYLLETEGTFKIEPAHITWWNPYLNKSFTRSTQEQTITVAANPDLGMLTTMRDSLQTSVPSTASTNKDEPLLIFGLSLKQFSTLAISLLVALWLIIKLTFKIIRYSKKRREQYLQSERFSFDELLKTNNKNAKQQLNALYKWLLRTKGIYTTDNLRNKETQSLLDAVFTDSGKKLSKKEIKSLRTRAKQNEDKPQGLFPTINP